jgi:uncharacterized protein (DUF1501 family)
MHCSCTNRRQFLAGGVTILGGLALPLRRTRFGGATSEPPRTLVLVELSGGNDGLNTVVPFREKVYAEARPRIALPEKQLLKIAEDRALHPDLKSLQYLFQSKQLAIVEGCGYPSPNRSHFSSQDIWYTGRAQGKASGDGWAGRLVAELFPEERRVPHAIHIGSTAPYVLHSSTHPVVYLEIPSAYRWAQNGPAIGALAGAKDMQGPEDPAEKIRAVAKSADVSSVEIRRAVAQYRPRLEYPAATLGEDLRTVAALLQADIGARVLSVTQTGYDTHDDELDRHGTLMRELDASLATFFEDVRNTPAGQRTVVVVYSEFGRRVADNASMGTDHGTAAPMFVLGTSVKGGLYGKHPSLEALDQGDLVHTTDFRSVFGTIVESWLGADPARVLGAKYPTLPLVA